MCETDVWWNDVGEPAVAELLADPMIDLLLGRDGLTRAEVWAAVADARRALRAAAAREASARSAA